MIFDVNAWLGIWPFRALRDNTPQTLIARLDRSGIDGAAVSLIEAIFHRNVQPVNDQLAELVAPYTDRLVPLATINPTYTKWEDDLDACHQKLGMKGVRLFPQYHNYEVDGPDARHVVEACKERGLPVFIPHRMEDVRGRHWMDPGKVVTPDKIANLVAAVPDATIVVPNLRGLARMPLWQREELRDLPWYVDLSLAEVHKDAAILVEEGGAKHLLFGTHLPISYAAPALVKRAILPIDEDTRADISYRNAARILKLDLKAA